MTSLADDTIGGYNSYVSDMQKEQGEAYLTTVLFDDRYIVLHDHVNIQDVPPLTNQEYSPLGMTALMDAIGKTINSVGPRLANTPEEERPAHVIFVITTDGYENASKEFDREQIKRMIKHQQEKYSWQFLFLGAGIDAYQEAASIGIGGMHAMSVSKSSVGTQSIYTSVSNASKAIRTSYCTTDCLSDESWKVGDLGRGDAK